MRGAVNQNDFANAKSCFFEELAKLCEECHVLTRKLVVPKNPKVLHILRVVTLCLFLRDKQCFQETEKEIEAF